MKLDNLEKILKSYKRITVALSGGVDSAFLLAFASKALGTQNVRAITACGPHLAEDEVEYAKTLCASLGIEHDVIDMDHIMPILAPNPADRCYHCKKAMFSTLKEFAAKAAADDFVLADGTNLDDMDDYSKGSSFYYETTNYNHKTSFDISRAVTEGTKEYNFIIKEIDMVSAELKRMAELDIPVLWRPLHEANGNWFWWGNHNEEHREAYKKLWYIIFDRMENYHKLPNLIWVWNGQDRCMEVNPNTYDIYGDDIYSQLTYDHT